jgi:hypothetical protein
MMKVLLWPYLLERKEGSKWYPKLFKRILNVAVYNAMVIYRSLPENKNEDALKFRVSLGKASWKNTVQVYLVLHMAVHQFNCRLKDSQNDTSLSVFLPLEITQNLKEKCHMLKT